MMRKKQIKRSWRVTTYHLAKWAWLVTAWIWTTIIIAFLAQFIPNLLTTDPKALQSTWTFGVLNWLRDSGNYHPPEILRWGALSLVFLLIAIPPLAFGLKQLLRDVEPKGGIDKLIETLQQDTLSPQLELLQQLLEQQLQKLETCIQALRGLFDLLQQAPTSANLATLYALSLQQRDLQKEQIQKLKACVQALGSVSDLLSHMPTSSDLHELRKAFSQTLLDIQKRAIEQVQWSADQFEQNQRHQKKVSEDLAKISLLLEQMSERLRILAVPDHRENGSLSDKQAATEDVAIVASPTRAE